MARDVAGEPAPEETANVLRLRAEALARPQRADEIPDAERLELLVVGIADERYGIEAQHVREVIAMPQPTRLPGAPPVVLGIVNYRGRILPLFDLRSLLGLPSVTHTATAFAAIELDAMRFGIAIDAVAGLVTVAASELFEPPPAPRGGRPVVRAVTRDMMGVIDLDALVADPRFTVNDEGGA